MDDSSQIRRALIQQLELLRASGVAELPLPNEVERPGEEENVAMTSELDPRPVDSGKSAEPSESVRRSAPATKSPLFESSGAMAYGEKTPPAEKAGKLAVIQQEVAACQRCAELASSRTQTVFGVGNPNARLCFVGEAPGADEDRQGEPFVGAAGQLLDRIIGACKMTREDVFILNTIKCRPPGNRNPGENEINNCWGYGLRQLEIIQPEFICCLGGVAANVVLQTNQSVGRMRGQFHSFLGSKVVVTYHPAYLLRTPSAKKQVWDDMKMLMREMGIEL